ncbi:hypothetical protein IDJ75_20130 [Mucilaginibacter rigui]|uniref:Uncharacterized protein n=1 Tax=Mucilaginibacter rigui TaxID=534635 RepID=A0ABR7XAL9_9SPHI|nr:hypothetical protein [Mucilaginibacter rigui]MBD1387604.1 hypothetical protein [Mucilaginibacter rigui]
MKRTLLLLLFALVFPSLSFAQKQSRLPAPLPHPFTKEENVFAEKHSQCFHQNKYNAKQRRAFFPFSGAVTIKLISYQAEIFGPDAVIYGEKGKIISGDKSERDTVSVLTAMAKNKYYLNFRKIKEIKTLNVAGIDSLTDILYNVGYTPVKKPTFTIINGASCYEPRNAVLFIDSKGNVTQYLEVCFSCMHHFWSSSKVAEIEYCDNKYELLRKYFLSQGIKYGADPKTINNE